MAKSHFSGVIIARENGQRPEVLIQPYLWRGWRQTKFPGGMNEEGESPLDTAVREARQEIQLEIAASDLEQVHEFAPGNDPNHKKHFFVTVRFGGSPRERPIKDNGGEDLAPPEWREVTAELLRTLLGQHRLALQRAMPVLARKLESFHWRARRLNLS